MRKSKFTEEQIAHALRQVEAGAAAKAVCRKLGVTETTFYRWKRVYEGMGVTELRRLRQLEDGNKKLQQLVAELMLDKRISRDVLQKKAEAGREAGARRAGKGELPRLGPACLRTRKPRVITCDNGSEFCSKLLDQWASNGGTSSGRPLTCHEKHLIRRYDLRNRRVTNLKYYLHVGAICLASTITLAAPSNGQERLLSSSTSTSSTLFEEEDFVCTATFKLHDPVALEFLQIEIQYFDNCISLVPGVEVSDDPFGTNLTGFPESFRGPAALLECTSVFPHDLCPPELSDILITIREAQAPNGLPIDPIAVCPERIECNDWPCGIEGNFVQTACGDVDASGLVQANDALAALRSAVGLAQCSPQLCDTDRDGTVNTSDARAILAAAVGNTGQLICPAPCSPMAD